MAKKKKGKTISKVSSHKGRKKRMMFYYGAGVLLCETHKDKIKNKSTKFTNQRRVCNYPGCKNKMPKK